ncbi:hypothetical protein CMO96_02895 [Candidatus Woesebacteria bacterium]|nr:hypothetical protein [Candidatus Woesebacteria bacterium]
MRGSIYINGFKPKDETDPIIFEGKHFLHKVTVRHVPSLPVVRVSIIVLSLGLLFVLAGELLNATGRFFKDWFGKYK